jgi:hypothetical protein
MSNPWFAITDPDANSESRSLMRILTQKYIPSIELASLGALLDLCGLSRKNTPMRARLQVFHSAHQLVADHIRLSAPPQIEPRVLATIITIVQALCRPPNSDDRIFYDYI